MLTFAPADGVHKSDAAPFRCSARAQLQAQVCELAVYAHVSCIDMLADSRLSDVAAVVVRTHVSLRMRALHDHLCQTARVDAPAPNAYVVQSRVLHVPCHRFFR